jgi:trigger factor
MKVTVTEPSASERQIEVVVDAKRVEGAFQKAFKKNLKDFALPGFRKGKVPPQMAQRYITDSGLVRDVIQDIVPKAFEEATKEQDLKPISAPEWDLVQNERGKDLIFKASFQISPILKIGGYEGLEIRQEKEQITEEVVQETLERMRENHAYFENVSEDRGIREGDFATVDYTSSQNGEEIENGSVKNYLMEMKNENYIVGFVENLVGMKPGEQKSFDINFPDDYNNEQLAGESVTFHFTVHDIKEKKYPELDDDFAASHSPKETLEELKQSIRERLEDGAKRQADGQAVTQIVKALLEQVSEESIPVQLRQDHSQRAIRGRMYEMAQRGVSLEQILGARGISQEEWIKEMMGVGLFEARLEVLYRSVARAEKVTVAAKEVDEVIAAEAPSHKLKPKQLKAQMQQNGTIEMLEYNLLMDKIQKLLLDKAEVTYVKPGETEEPKAQDEPKAKKASKAKKAGEESVQEATDSDQESAKEAPEGKKATKKKAAPKAGQTVEGEDTAPAVADDAKAAEKSKKAKASKKAAKATAKSKE